MHLPDRRTPATRCRVTKATIVRRLKMIIVHHQLPHNFDLLKVVGQLMVDNYHFKAADDCGLSNATSGCWRSTIWEMHPVSQFFVCNLSAGCDASSPDSAWTSLDTAH